jgi:hypothetical protein
MGPIQEELRQSALAWVTAHPNDIKTIVDWHVRGSVLRLLRLLEHQDLAFWRKEFAFWVPQLVQQPEQFVAISRALMQSVRVLGPMGVLNSGDFGAMFAAGLRGGHFPVHEVYAALEEMCKFEKVDGPNVAEELRSAIRLAAKDACSPDVTPAINEANYRQMERTLRSWVKNCLMLGDVQVSDKREASFPPAPRAVAGFPVTGGGKGFYDKPVELQ